jgi:hypothetical protein
MKPLEHGEKDMANNDQSHAGSGSILSIDDAGKLEGKTLAQLQNERRKIETDAIILSNRLALLRHEEDKTAKKIDETRRKALEIYKRKQEIEARKQKRADEEAEIAKSLQSNQRESLDQKHKVQERINSLRVILQQERHKEYSDVRAQQEEHLRRRQEMRYRESEERKRRVELVKEMKAHASKKLEDYYMSREMIAKQNYEEKKKREAERKSKLKMEIIEMEKRESDLLSMLQQRQTLHKEAYAQLEDALAMPSHDFAKRYHVGHSFNVSPYNKKDTGMRRGGLGNRSTLLQAMQRTKDEKSQSNGRFVAASQQNMNRTVDVND